MDFLQVLLSAPKEKGTLSCERTFILIRRCGNPFFKRTLLVFIINFRALMYCAHSQRLIDAFAQCGAREKCLTYLAARANSPTGRRMDVYQKSHLVKSGRAEFIAILIAKRPD